MDQTAGFVVPRTIGVVMLIREVIGFGIGESELGTGDVAWTWGLELKG